MPIETASGTAQCPECFADVTLNKVMQNEITQCPGCEQREYELHHND